MRFLTSPVHFRVTGRLEHMTAVLEPAFCFGLKADVRDNICFLDEQTVLYPAGSSLIVYNVDTRTQRFIQVCTVALIGLSSPLRARSLRIPKYIFDISRATRVRCTRRWQ